MNRNEEYRRLIAELDDAPPALEHTVDRARARARKSRAGRWLGIPAASLGGVAAAFVLLVNTCVPFARACGNVPLLRDLALAVAFSPSLKAAVENDFVQTVARSQTVNGVTMSVEYLIVDDRQLNIFYRLHSDEHTGLAGFPELTRPDGSQFADMGLSYGEYDSAEDLGQVTADFMSTGTPEAFQFHFRAYGGAGEPRPVEEDGASLAEFTFDLEVDPRFLHTGEVVELNRALDLSGEHITVKSVDIYPTHLRLNLEDDPGNTAWLRDLEFYLEDENGRRYDPITNGITATGDPGGTPFYPSHRLESSYFGGAEHLTLHITGATWLDKDALWAEIDLLHGSARGLPAGVTLETAQRRGAAVELAFHYDGPRPAFSWDYLDPEGGARRWESMSTDALDGYRLDHVTLEDYPWDTVRLGLNYTRTETFSAPVTLEIK